MSLDVCVCLCVCPCICGCGAMYLQEPTWIPLFSVIFQVRIFKTLLTKEKVADALIYCNEQLENMELLRRYIPRQRLCFTQEGWVPPS